MSEEISPSSRTDRWAIVGDGCWWKVCGGHWASDPSEHEGSTVYVMPVFECEAALEVLRYLADPNNWLGDPIDQNSTLHGHFTPYELARDALAKSHD